MAKIELQVDIKPHSGGFEARVVNFDEMKMGSRDWGLSVGTAVGRVIGSWITTKKGKIKIVIEEEDV